MQSLFGAKFQAALINTFYIVENLLLCFFSFFLGMILIATWVPTKGYWSGHSGDKDKNCFVLAISLVLSRKEETKCTWYSKKHFQCDFVMLIDVHFLSFFGKVMSFGWLRFKLTMSSQTDEERIRPCHFSTGENSGSPSSLFLRWLKH